MSLGLTILIWLLVIAISIVFLIYGITFILTVALVVKDKRDFKKSELKQQERLKAFKKYNQERMKKFREEHSHIIKGLERYHKEWLSYEDVINQYYIINHWILFIYLMASR